MTTDFSLQDLIDRYGCSRSTAQAVVASRQAEATLKRIDVDLAATVTGYRSTVEQIEGRWDLGDDSKSAGRQLAEQEARQRIAALKAEHEAGARTLTQSSRAAASFDGGGGVEGELRRQAAWNRQQRLLDRASDTELSRAAIELAETVIGTGDPAAINSYRREIGDYLASRGAPALPRVVASHLDVMASDIAGEASVRLQDTTEPIGRTNVAFDQAAAHLTDPNVVLPRWDGTVDSHGVEVSTSNPAPAE